MPPHTQIKRNQTTVGGLQHLRSTLSGIRHAGPFEGQSHQLFSWNPTISRLHSLDCCRDL